MASRPNTVEVEDLTYDDGVTAVIGDLQNALANLDTLGLTQAGAMLSSVLDLLMKQINDVRESGQAIRS